MSPYRRAVAAAAAAVLLLTGCSDSAAEDAGTSGNVPDPIRLYGSDGVMQEELAAGLASPAVLAGMKGTAPLNQLPTEFTNRLLEIDSSLTGFQYAGETYDAVVISALAAELAGTPEPEQVRGYVNSVTAGGERCTTVATCLELARAGEQLEYAGVSLRSGFTDDGQPAAATYATLHFDAGGSIDEAKTEFVGAGDPAAVTDVDPPASGDRPQERSSQTEPLRFGGLLPETGSLAAAYHAAMAAAAELAVTEINEAGGVFGVDVEWSDGNDGSFDVAVARATLAAHVADGVHVLIGPAASDTTEAMLPEAVAARRIMFSPSSTRADLSTAAHDGFFFRTAPPDDLQGEALADLLLRDGAGRVVIVAENGAYGTGLQQNLTDALQRYGVPSSELARLSYAPAAGAELPPGEVESLVEQIQDAEPDAVVLIGFGETAQIVQAMIDAGLPLPA